MEPQKNEMADNVMTIKKAWVAPSICSLENIKTESGVPSFHEAYHNGISTTFSS